jgi:hypothetical protein
MARTRDDDNAIFNIFFCSPKWEAAMEEVPSFLDWATAFFGIDDFTVAARLGGLTEQSKPLHGSYTRLKRKIWQPALVHLVMDVYSYGVKVAFSFENRHPRLAPVYVSYLFPGVETEADDCYGDLKILSLSVRENVFHGAVREHGEPTVKERLEKLFIALGCVYGYAWHAPKLLTVATSSYALIPQADQSTNRVRVIDYDYSHHIHDVFAYNYLSPAHMASLPDDPERLCDRLSQFDCKMLYNAAGELKGAAIYVDSPNAKKAARQALKQVIQPVDDPPVGSGYLLLSQQQVAVAGGVEALNEFEFVDGVEVLPYGFVQVLSRSDIEYQASFASLQLLYERIYPPAKGCRGWVQDDMVSYQFLTDGMKLKPSTGGVSRIPKLGMGDDYYGYAKLFYGPGIDLEGLDIWFLIGVTPDPDGVQALAGAVDKWLSHLAGFPEAYGRVGLIEGAKFLTIGTKTCGHIKADFTSIKDEAIDLLMIVMDETNLKGCKIQFVVLGEPYLPTAPTGADCKRGGGPDHS